MKDDNVKEMTKEARLAREAELHDLLRGEHNADEYNSNRKFYAVAQRSHAFVESWLARRVPGARVLDYCCGEGPAAMKCAAQGAEAWGIDISPVSIETATQVAAEKGLTDRTHFAVMDAEATGFEDSFFDVIIVNGVLHHLDLDKAYAELARILKPTGAVICTEALRHNLAIHAYRKLTPHLRSEWEVAHILGKPEIEQAKRAFDSVEVGGFFHFASLAAVPFRNMPGFRFLLGALELVDRVLLKLPVVRWQAWMAVFILSRPRKFSRA